MTDPRFRRDQNGKQRGLDWSKPEHGQLANPTDQIVDRPPLDEPVRKTRKR